MIKIQKSGEAPERLQEKGETETKKLCQAYDEGMRSFSFPAGIYNHSTVKEELKKAQHEKCCFCESKFTSTSFGDIEHFRPKGEVKQEDQSTPEKPGYFWLVYDWSNLLFSCEICNRTNKKTLFPLKYPENRDRNHNDDLSLEEPLLINPTEVDPMDYIAFRNHLLTAVNEHPVGKTTISVLALNRKELRQKREEELRKFEIIYDLSKGIPKTKKQTKAKEWVEKHLMEIQQGKEEFSAMFRDFLQTPKILK